MAKKNRFPAYCVNCKTRKPAGHGAITRAGGKWATRCDTTAPSAPDATAYAPPPGSWAETAWLMAQEDDDGFDWDLWKDEMKERDLD